MSVRILDSEDWLVALRQARQKTAGNYRAMYSSWCDGIVTAPELMVIPVDDHMVHRGDGIFEAARVVDGAFFDLDAHLLRLERSARQIDLKLRWHHDELKELCVATGAAAKLKEAALRLFVGRGPGSFSPNPYESPESQLYIVITEFKPLPEERYKTGVRAMISKIPQKHPFFSQIKSCNYLPNVLMKKESVDAGYDFSLGIDSEGRILEGATENLAVLHRDGRLMVPKFDYTLRGTTLMATLEALEEQRLSGIDSVEFRDLGAGDFKHAAEAFMIGTTLEVLPVVEVDGQKIGTGKPGLVGAELRRRLQKQMRASAKHRTEIPL